MSLLIIGLAFAISTATVADVTCPPPGMVAPRYPVDRLRSDTAGKTIVLARIDDCGRVVEAKVHEGSGYADLDAAALLAAQSSVLSPVQRASVPTGWVKLPFAFQGLSRITVSAPDWPRSHRRPVYLIDDQAIGFATIQSLEDAKLMRDIVLRSPYGRAEGGAGTFVMTRFDQERAKPNHFWLSYTVQTSVAGPNGARRYVSETVAMARYRLVEEDGKPVVRLGMLCEATEPECAQITSFLLEGLPFAKPPRR